MAEQVTFKVSKKDDSGKVMKPIIVTCTRKPQVIEEWETLGLVKSFPAGVNELAFEQWTIKAQGAARSHYPDAALVQKAVDEYIYEERAPRAAGVSKKPSLSASKVREARFTEAQLAMLREAGFVIEAPEQQAAA